MQTLTFDGYRGRFAPPTKEGVDEIFNFLKADGRPSQVYERPYKKVEESVYAGLFWGIWKEIPNSAPRLIATSAIFLHGMESIPITEKSTERGIVVERGAVLRRKELEGDSYPKGILMQILASAPLIQLFHTAGRKSESGSGPILADIVFNDVQQGSQLDYVRNFIRSEPHNWEEIVNPSSQLLAKFKSSVNDPNANRSKDFNRFFVSSIPAMAEIVLNALTTGSLKSEYNGTVYEAKIDLSGLPENLKEALPVIVEKKEFFKEIDKCTSFTEARNLFESYIAAASLRRELLQTHIQKNKRSNEQFRHKRVRCVLKRTHKLNNNKKI